MNIVLFPIVAGLIMLVMGGLLATWRKFPIWLARQVKRLPIKMCGLFWLVLAVGVWLAASYQVNSFILYAGAVIMLVDSLTFIFLPSNMLSQAVRWYGKTDRWYSILYGFLMLVLGGLILVDSLPYLN